MFAVSEVTEVFRVDVVFAVTFSTLAVIRFPTPTTEPTGVFSQTLPADFALMFPVRVRLPVTTLIVTSPLFVRMLEALIVRLSASVMVSDCALPVIFALKFETLALIADVF